MMVHGQKNCCKLQINHNQYHDGIATNRAILGQLENVVKNIYPEGATFAGMLGHMPFLLKDN